MRTICLNLPQKLVFGNGCSDLFIADYKTTGCKTLLLITTEPLLEHIHPLTQKIKADGADVFVYQTVNSEPTIEDFQNALHFAQQKNIDSVAGIGGGSVLDLAKLLAAMLDNDQNILEMLDGGRLKQRQVYLACLPTTSGTGSEVSPNAILLDETDNLKKGVTSSYLIPDAAYINPLFTKSVPPSVTATTGLDALIHCIEEYTNLYAHPVIDMFALEGIRLIGSSLWRAYNDGNDEKARENMALGSLYGGIGLGSVNTAAVHALSYPLGGEYHIPHGLSNAVLFPYVMKFNMVESTERYATVARALGGEEGKNDYETAQNGVDRIFQLCEFLNVKVKLSTLNIPKTAVQRLAEAAMKVERLLKNNPRHVTLEDAKKIYHEAY
ncbi:MAG: iron-containing alcohol dehydrogenase [candidate division KSB1 bacterium]|nr:iron-containing alcohol dehydrogenase [candidate division KSB1 bacterium]